MKSSVLWCLSCCLLIMSYIVMTVVSDVSNAQIGPALIVCPDDLDCVVTCSPYTRNCYNTRIICPGSNTSLTYNCTIECNSSLACVGTVIESGSAVSTLTFWSSNPNTVKNAQSSENIAIITNGTDQVLIMCEGQACAQVNVTSSYASLVSLVATSGSTQPSYDGMLNISNTQNVMIYCNDWACSYSYWFIDTVENFHLQCFNSYGCVGNYLQINDAANILIESIMLQYLFFDGDYIYLLNQVNISDVATVIVNISNGTAIGSFSLMNIENFLYKTGPAANPLLTWNVQNVSNIALDSWNATSFWILDDFPIQKQYTCPNGQDCNIRMDANLIATNLSSISVLCPMDSISHSHTTCQFYCSSTTSGCGIVDLRVKDVTNAALYLTNPASSHLPFSLNTSAWGLTDVNTTLNITCGFQSCVNDTFIISGYANTNVAILYELGCSNTTFNVSGFSHVTMLSNRQGLVNAYLSLTDGDFVHLLSNPNAGASYQESHWKFSNIERVEIDCFQTLDCAYASFDSVTVGEVSVVCDNHYYSQTSDCTHTIFNNSVDTSFNLTCAGLYDACDSLIIQYNGSNPDKTSLALSCYMGDLYPTYTNCQNISILVTDNKIGYDAITFFCQTATGYEACENVTVSCGTDGIMCRCPVKYSDADNWYCDGECGSVSCPADTDTDTDGDNKLSDYAIGGIALASLVVIIGVVVVCIKMRCCRKKNYESLLDAPQE